MISYLLSCFFVFFRPSPSSLLSPLARLTVAAAAATAYLVSFAGNWPEGFTPANVLLLAAAGAAGLVVYGTGCLLLGVEEVRGVLRRLGSSQ